MLLNHDSDRLALIDRRLALAAALCVGDGGLSDVLRQAEVVHDEAAGLVAEDAVDAGDGLEQPVAAHGLVDVHGVQARSVEAGEPHVAHQHDLEWVLGIAEALCEGLAPWLVADVRLPVGRVSGRAGHHHLDRAPAVVIVVPFGAEAH